MECERNPRMYLQPMAMSFLRKVPRKEIEESLHFLVKRPACIGFRNGTDESIQFVSHRSRSNSRGRTFEVL